MSLFCKKMNKIVNSAPLSTFLQMILIYRISINEYYNVEKQIKRNKGLPAY